MNSKLENKISMWMVLRLFLQGKVSEMTSLPGFAALLTLFSTTIDEILVIVNALGMTITGYAQMKQQGKDKLVLKTAEIAGKIKAYAVITGDILLKDKMSITVSALKAMADTVMVSKAQEVYDKAMELGAAIIAYGVAEQDLEDMLSMIGDYVAVIPEPRKGIVDRRHSNEALLIKVEQGDGTVKKMDALMEIIRYSNPQLYSDYWASHKIIDTSTRIRSLQMEVKDGSSGLPVSDASVTVKKKGGTELTKTVKRTGDKGIIYINQLEAGEYEYEVTFGGFTKITGSFFVNDGVMTKTSVIMEPVTV